MSKDKLKPMLFSTMKHYTKEQLLKDVVAGIIVAIIALPLSIALALASGVGPEEGLYTAIVAGFLISFFGGSRVQIAGPTAAFATIVAGIVAKSGMEGLMMSTIIAGIILILLGVLRLGSLIKFIPYPITTGFTAGIAATLFIGQLKDFLGITYPKGTVTIETMEKISALIKYGNTINIQSVVVGIVCVAVLILWTKVPKIGDKVPAPLIAIFVGIAMVKGLGMNVNTIGDLYTITNKLPTFHMPTITFELIKDATGNGITIAVLAAIESLLSCVVADSMINSHHRSNQELIAQGIGNIGSALFGGIPATGAIARTAANIKNGGRTPVSGIVHSITLVLILVVLMPYAALIPMPTIAAILFIVAYNMSNWRTFLRLCKTAPLTDVIALVVTFVLTVVFDLVVAIGAGMGIACVLLMKKLAEESDVKGWKYHDNDDENNETDVDSIELRQVRKEIRVYEINGPMFFGVADRINQITIKDFTKVLVIRMRGVPTLDVTALHSLEMLYDEISRKGIDMVFSHVNAQPMAAMKKSGFVEKVGKDNFCAHIDDALSRAEDLLNK